MNTAIATLSGDLPSRFQLDERVSIRGRSLARVVGVTFARVDSHDGFGEGAKVYYTVEYAGGRREELISNDVDPVIQKRQPAWLVEERP